MSFTSVSSVFPSLNLRKDIWTHYPVNLVPLGKGEDGAERHAIVWHRKRLQDWRANYPKQYANWLSYETWTKFRLFHSLRNSTHWIVEEPKEESHLCIIKMLFDNQAPKPVLLPINEALPNLTSLNDIKDYFPVVWHKKSEQQVYSIELYSKKLKDAKALFGYDLTEICKHRLLASLKASTAWKVTQSAEHGAEFCEITLI